MEIEPKFLQSTKMVYIVCRQPTTTLLNPIIFGVYDSYDSAVLSKGMDNSKIVVGPVPYHSSPNFNPMCHKPSPPNFFGPPMGGNNMDLEG